MAFKYQLNIKVHKMKEIKSADENTSKINILAIFLYNENVYVVSVICT
jgi:hypothetical protein